LIVVLALVFFALHLPYLPASLEDLDSINFALGVRQFDVAHHQPHPPGYPVFILIAKAVHTVVPSEATALALVSAGAGALGVLALAAVFRRLDEDRTPPAWRVAPVAVAMTAPLYWFTAVRPLSDAAGLAAALAVQAMTLAAGTPRALAIAAFGAGVATGIRSQVAWLTVPLLALRALQGLGIRGWGLEGRRAEGEALVPNPNPNPCSSVWRAPPVARAARGADWRADRTGTRCSIRAPRISATSRCCGHARGEGCA
jgi:hypothetical protein